MSLWNFVNPAVQAGTGLLKGVNARNERDYQRQQEAEVLKQRQQALDDQHRMDMLKMYMMSQGPQQSSRPQVVGPGGSMVGSDGKVIFQAPFAPKTEPLPKARETQALGNELWERQDDGSWKKVATGPALQGVGSGKPATQAEARAMIGADNAVTGIGKARDLLANNPEANVTPKASAFMEGLGNINVPFLGKVFSGMTESARQEAMTPDQQEFQADMDTMLHNAVGLLPSNRQSQQIFQNLRATYVPPPGSSEQARTARFQMLEHLARNLEIIRHGNFTADEILYYLNNPDVPIPGSGVVAPHQSKRVTPGQGPPPGPPASTSAPRRQRADPNRFYHP